MINALISIKPQYVKMILSGDKSVEIRNKPVNLEPGTCLWIYSTLPRGCLEAVARVQLIGFNLPKVIWNHYCEKIGISHKAFLSYVNGSSTISAIFLEQISELKPPLTLSDLRSEIQGFHPPQFLKRIENVSPFLSLLRAKNVKPT